MEELTMRTEDSDVRRTGISRRSFLRLAAVSGGAAILAACGGQPASQAPTAAPGGGAAPAATTAPAAQAPATVAPTSGQVTIEWLNRYTTPTTQEMIPLMIGEFEKANPDIKVQYENPGMSEGAVEALLARIAGGNPPDVAVVYEPPVEFAARGSLLAIDDYMAAAKTARPDAFYAAPLRSTQWQGKTYGLPSSAGAGSMYFNTDKFTEKGIDVTRDGFPKTWDEVKALSAEFVEIDGGTVKQVGFVPFVGNEWLYPAWSAMNGGKLFDAASNTYTLDSDANVAWLDSWLTWLDEQYGGNLEQLNIAGGWGDVYPDSGFGQQLSAMSMSGSWAVTDADMPFGWEVARLPYGPGGSKSMTGFWPNWWVIPQGAKNPEASFRLIEFIATTGWETWYRYIMDTPAWRNFPPEVTTTKLVDQVGQERAQDLNTFFADYLNDAVEMWTSPVESFAQETLTTAVGEVLNKVKTPKEALAEAQTLCQDRLNETLKA
jgi:multiple sugar transport system substrate-binding protein